MKGFLLVTWLLLLSLFANAQDTSTEVQDILEQMLTLEDTESEEWATNYETLTALANNKIDLNRATTEDLLQIPFLHDEQIDELCQYLYRHAPIKNWGELTMLKTFDERQRQLLRAFTYLGNVEKNTFPSLTNILKYGKHELTTTVHLPFYTREGDHGAYQGPPYRHSVRYNFRYGQYVKAGIIGSQDAGEPFFSKNNPSGYDYYSFYLNIKKYKHIQSLVIGRYRMRLGMGLVLNNDFSFGKLMTLSSMGNMTPSLRPHSSRSEASYMQGLAATIKINKYLNISPFISYRSLDATLNSTHSSITTILTSGYHRTTHEIDKKGNVREWVAGNHLYYRNDRITAGLTTLYNSYNLPLKPNTSQKFRQYYPKGKDFFNASVNYGYRYKRLNIQGETALSVPLSNEGNKAAFATINTLTANLTQSLSLTALQRFYSYQYAPLHARSFSDGGSVQNESGFYIGANWHPRRTLAIYAYSDFAYFPWPKYLISQASHSWDNCISAVYEHKNITFSTRYRIRLRQVDNEKKTSLTNKTEQRGRLSVTVKNPSWSYKAQLDAALSQVQNTSCGYMVSQSFSYLWPTHKKLQTIASLSYFHTDDYDSRLYNYERDMMYAFSFPVYFGHGLHGSLWANIAILSNLTLTARISTTKYYDRSVIGSGHQQINHSSQTDLHVQARWTF